MLLKQLILLGTRSCTLLARKELYCFVFPSVSQRPFLTRFMKRAVDGQVLSSIAMSTTNGDGIPTIGTHNGTFHCDEALACYMLKLLPQYKDAKIVRSRDESVLSGCTVVCDVGGVFDPQKLRFDHHQRSFGETMNSLDSKKPWQIKLSSAGLVYAHFGRDIIAEILGLSKENNSLEIELIFDKVYENFIQEVDAIDNGVNQYEGDVQPKYTINTNLSSRVKHLNPLWNDSNQDTEEGFKKAMQLTGTEFVDRVQYYAKSWLPARDIVLEAVNNRFEDGKVIEFTKGGCPWKEHLFSIEEQLGIVGDIKYVIYTDLNGSFRVQCVPVSLDSFQSRLPLPEAWRGIRDDELSKLSGIDGCIFVHASGFIGGNKTRDGALEMARKSLKMANV